MNLANEEKYSATYVGPDGFTSLEVARDARVGKLENGKTYEGLSKETFDGLMLNADWEPAGGGSADEAREAAMASALKGRQDVSVGTSYAQLVASQEDHATEEDAVIKASEGEQRPAQDPAATPEGDEAITERVAREAGVEPPGEGQDAQQEPSTQEAPGEAQEPAPGEGQGEGGGNQ